MSKAVFPGTFDPPTYGHLNLIKRASLLFDSIDVLISVNPDKKTLFSEEERFNLLTELTKDFSNVTVHKWNGLVVDYCAKAGSKVLLRGIRNTVDFSYEFDLSLMNRSLDSEVETLFMPTEQKYFLIRSSSIKEVARLGGNISLMVPPAVEKALKEKYNIKN
ncbi:pantetheine-phosphate adenylyltransferase [Treponema sp.]|uniref:pantetheine-phosphate adenylyltransferase n=1 Tax=Treponema sp. TaxID=166 RepID=UPI00257BC6AF|nr:pantetheine-phosphate adenylyltransferase [Treponema sp.]MBE6353917.1 pantetheine-phosphate adenylyltransferase [Treponema sp.]